MSSARSKIDASKDPMPCCSWFLRRRRRIESHELFRIICAERLHDPAHYLIFRVQKTLWWLPIFCPQGSRRRGLRPFPLGIRRRVLQDPQQSPAGKVEAKAERVRFQPADDPQRLAVSLETTMVAHGVIQCRLAAVA